VKRKRKYGKTTRSAITTRPTARSGGFPEWFGIRLSSSSRPSDPNAIAAHMVGRSRRLSQNRNVTNPSATYATRMT